MKNILYMGDDALDRAAAYLGGVLTHAGLSFDYVPSDEAVDDRLLGTERSLYIISDFPVKNFRDDQLRQVVEHVKSGAGLLMIGGWESFHGARGEYHDSPLSECLCVDMMDSDDRVNCAQPCLVEVAREHPVIEGLPFDSPPGIGGFNRIIPKETSKVVLSARRFRVNHGEGKWTFRRDSTAYPLLVVDSFGQGRTAAFATDVAPHWVGGLVDWGPGRVTSRADGGSEIEVGNLYARLLEQVVRWAARLKD